jgi:hypothetical protein
MPTINLRVDWASGIRYTVAVEVRRPIGRSDRGGSNDVQEGDAGGGVGPMAFPDAAPMPRDEPDESRRIGEVALDSRPELKKHLRRITRNDTPGATVEAWIWDRDEERLLELLDVPPPIPDLIPIAVGGDA